MTKRKKWAAPFVLILLAVLLDLVLCNGGVLFLSAKGRSVYMLVPQVSRTEDGGEVITTMTLAPEGYTQKITLSLPELDRDDYLPYKVYLEKAGRANIFKQTEYLPYGSNVKDTISIRDKAGKIHFVFEGDIEPATFMVDNSIRLNGRRIMVWLAGLVCGWLLFVFKSVVAQRLETGFLIIAATLGLAFAITMPSAVGLTFDDQEHLRRSFDSVYSFNGTKEQELANIIHLQWTAGSEEALGIHPYNTAEDNGRYHQGITKSTPMLEEPKRASVGALTDIGYVTQTAGLWAARLIGLPLHWQLVCGRLGNLALYTLVCYWAIRLAKRYKAVFFVVALGPTSLFLAGSYSSDPTVTAFCLLGISIFLSELLTPQRTMERSRAAVMLCSFVVGDMPKAVYGVLLALPLLLPAGKFEGKRQRRWFKGVTLAVMALMLASFVLPALMGTSEHSDTRGGATSVSGQMAFIFSNPITYLGIFLKSVFTLSNPFLTSMQNSFPYLTHSNNGVVQSINSAMTVFFFALLLFVVFTDHQKQKGVAEITGRSRAGISAVLLAALALIWTALYLSFTPVGQGSIAGVQGRYYIPLLPLAAVLLNMRGQSGGMEAGKYNLSIAGMSGAGLFLMLTVLCVVNFWL